MCTKTSNQIRQQLLNGAFIFFIFLKRDFDCFTDFVV
jgi:hypothetical protein